MMRVISQCWLQCTFSNILTLSRIGLLPIIISHITKHHWSLALLWFSIAGLTDLLDGFFARLFNQQTWIGSILDPIADKTLILVTFLYLATIRTASMSLPVPFVWIMILKECCLFLGTILLSIAQGGVQIKPIMLSKVSTFLQMMTVVWYFLCCACDATPYVITMIWLWLVSLVAIAVVILYAYHSGGYVLQFFKNMIGYVYDRT